MTPQEFKAWFDGFTEAMEDRPNAKQWKRIKARVAEIDGKSVTERVFVDRYWHWTSSPHYPYYHVNGMTIAAQNNALQANNTGQATSYNSTVAMYALGKAEAMSGSCAPLVSSS